MIKLVRPGSRFEPTPITMRSIDRSDATLATLIAICLVLQPSAMADDWRTWRGPFQDGRADADGYFGDGSVGLQLVWQKRMGSAYSGLAVSRGRLLVPFADGVDDWLAALDAKSGAVLWKHRIGRMYPAHDGGHDGPLSTPAADDDSVYLLGPRGKLFALDLESGDPKWSVNLATEYAAREPFWGFCSSPALNAQSIFVQVSGKSEHGIVAFDPRHGSVQWKQPLGGTDYRSPILAYVNGTQQLICCSRNETRGLDPNTGTTMWSIPTETAKEMTPVSFDGNQVLVTGRSGVQLFGIEDGKAEPGWNTNEFRGTYGTPIFHNGYLYGFSYNAFSCVDAETGKRVWRSRMAGGGKAQILVDGHLVVFSVTGDVVVFKATSNGYEERARLAISSADGYASPVFADGLIFARDLSGNVFAIAASTASDSEQPRSPPDSDFATFIESLRTHSDKEQAITEFLKAQESIPVIEDGRLVHFVFHGDATDVAVFGSMIAVGEADALQRVPGTNLFHGTYEIEPGARWEYNFIVDFENYTTDPRNPRVSLYDTRRSELVTEGWTEPPWAEQFTGQERGRLEQIKYKGETAHVYLPHGYDQSEDSYELVVVTEGNEWLNRGKAQDLLDQLHQTRVAPMIVAFPARGGLGGSGTSSYAEEIAKDLVPALDREFRTQGKPESRTILGKRGAGVVATYTALRYPDVFGHCIAISYGRADTVRKQAINRLIGDFEGDKPSFRISWNRYEVWRPQSFSCRDQSKEITQMLSAAGFEVSGGEHTDSSNWRSWRIHFGSAFIGDGGGE